MRKLWYVVKERDPYWPLELLDGNRFTHDILEAQFSAWVSNNQNTANHYIVKAFTGISEDDE